MIQSMLQLRWNRIAIIFEDDTYGREATALLKSRGEQESICVSITEGIPVKDGVEAHRISTVLNNIIVGSGSRPYVNGIVFIGSSSTARSVLNTLNSAGFSSVPIIMLSEGVNMETSVFRQFNGQLFSKAKGSLVLVPTYREVTEFSLHWKSVFTNETYFQGEQATNRWLLDVYHEVTQCEERDCEFSEMTDSQFTSSFGVQPLYIQYSVLAAHTLVKGIKLLHDDLCPLPGACSSFGTDFLPDDVLDKLKGISINMATDFQWRLESLSSPELEMEINTSGEMSLPGDKPNYQLFNLRKTSDHAPDFALVKIGDFTDMELTIDTDKLRDYDNEGTELAWPDVRIAKCSAQTKCADCIPIEDLQNSFIYEPGDIYLVAVLPVFDKAGTDECGSIRTLSGYQIVESVRFAIEKVNTKSGDFANFFPGMKVGLVVLNTCNNPVVVQRKIFNLFENGITLENGTVVDLTSIIGFVGDVGSGVSIGVAEVLSRLKFVQISFASTSSVLSDRSKYPYFLRIVSPDDAQAKAMVGILQKLNVNYVQIVYSVGFYGEGGKDKIKEAADENKVCVVQEIPVEETGSPFEIYEQLRRFSHARIVIIFLRSHMIEKIMSALLNQIRSRGEFVFIGSEAWARKRDPLSNDDQGKLLGSYTLSVEMYQDNALKDHIRKLKPKPYKQNPWSMTYLQAKRNCYFDFSFDKSLPEKCTDANDFFTDPNFVLDTWDTPAFVATKCLLYGANSFWEKVCSKDKTGLCEEFTNSPTGLLEAIRKTRLDLDGSGNKIKVFNDNGDGNIGYRIYNIQKDDDLNDLIYVEIGRYPLEGTFTFEKQKTVTPNGAEIVSTCPNEQACSGCYKKEEQRGETPKSDKSIDVGMLALGVLLAVVVIVVVILVLVILRLRKKQNDANQVYLTPMATNGSEEMKRQEAVGSEEFQEIPPCALPAALIQTTDT